MFIKFVCVQIVCKVVTQFVWNVISCDIFIFPSEIPLEYMVLNYFSGIPLKFQWNFFFTVLQWNSSEIPVEFQWNFFLPVEFHWNCCFHCIPVEFQWNSTDIFTRVKVHFLFDRMLLR
jgi:hypothetical protein